MRTIRRILFTVALAGIAALAPVAASSAEPAGSAAILHPSPTCDWVASYAGAWVPMHRPTNTVTCYLGQGDTGEGVRKLQHTMNLCYGESLTEDGQFGSRTRAALIRTQGAAGTAPDGEYGPNTRRAIRHQPVNGGACVRVP